ncbi:MAG: sulfatase-like hydrolase/transferase [Chitinophagaceae bacterium]
MIRKFKMKYILIYVMLHCIYYGCSSNDKTVSNKSANIPNVVMVLVDDLRWDEFGLAGHKYIKTPNIDRIAKEGIWFKNAFTTTPLCSPSRAGFLTGQYAHSHGIIDNTDRSKLSHHLNTFPMKLDSMGYETAFIGKWHMGNDNTHRPGFDFWAALKGQGEAIDPEFNVNGKEIKEHGYVTDVLTKYSLNFIKDHDPNTPFLLYLSQKGLHPNLYQDATGKLTKIGEGGFIAAERHKGMYKDDFIVRRPNAYITPKDKPALMRKIKDLPILGKETATPEQDIRDRAEMLMAIDEGLGEILDVLEKKGELDKTVIIFAGDEGYFYGEHGLNEERRLAYEESLRIPMLIRYPPMIEKGMISEKLVLNIDIAPTLIALAGGEPGPSIEGKSLLPLFKKSESEDWRNSFLMEYYSDSVWPRAVNLGYKGIRTDRYKYIQYTDLQGMNEFYDLEKDPYELNNSIKDMEYDSLINVMKKKITFFLVK